MSFHCLKSVEKVEAGLAEKAALVFESAIVSKEVMQWI